MSNPQQVLQTVFGYPSFRKPQGAIIDHILEGKRTLALLPTGQGKSLCFQIPGLVLPGLTVVISPLIALMKDQVDALHKRGIAAHYVNSTLTQAEVKAKYRDIKAGQCKFLYVAPERLLTERFLTLMKNNPPDFIAVDEAHCFSTWGHDFRPHYRDIPTFINQLPKQPKLSLFTATASRQVVEDLKASFIINNSGVFRGSFFRDNLFITISDFTLHSQRFLYLVYLLLHVHRNQSGLIYVATRKQAEMLCQALKRIDFERQLAIDYYHAGRSNEEKMSLQEKFLNDDLKIIIATNAFGMGIDKANIRFVIHFQTPGSLENYVQEIGRAGRDRQFSWCELLFHPADLQVHQQMQAGKDNRRGQRSLNTMVRFLTREQCHHQKILDYFQDPTRFEHGCGRCEYCSPYSQVMLHEIKQTINQRRELPTFVAQQQFVLSQNHQPDFAKLIGVGSGMLE